MQKQEIYQQISALLVKLFEIDEDDIRPDAKLYEDLELDSIDAVDLVVHLQKITGRKLSLKCLNLFAPFRMLLMP